MSKFQFNESDAPAPSTFSRHLVYVVTEDWYFVSHRLDLAKAALAAGYRVSVITRVRTKGRVIADSGIDVIPFEHSRGGVNPIHELLTIRRLVVLYRRARPDLLHHVALKPTLYGGLAARLTGSRRSLGAVAGMGWMYSAAGHGAGVLRIAVRRWLRWTFTRSYALVQNPDDEFVLRGLGVPSSRIFSVPGSGVDLEAFPPVDEPADHPVAVVLPARLLSHKGVREFVAAARALRADGVSARFLLAGDIDVENRASIPPAEVHEWGAEGVVELLGWVEDMPSLLGSSNVVCLPSYREGLPRALIEACAAGRPIVSTDVPGCRDVVEHNVNGLLVPARDVDGLISALRILIEDPARRREMGRRGRLRAEREFSIDVITAQMLNVYEAVLR